MVEAVKAVSFQIEPGEIVGFLGPNGAGKTTTLKMLSGLLHPTSGTASVLGSEPHRRSHAFLKRISLIMGNRNSLQWDTPAADSFELQRAVYDIPRHDFEARRDDFVEMLDAGDLITKPVRNLSLGERMKVEMIAGLLHAPDVLFLDEPTLGLDLSMQKKLRQFVAQYRDRSDAAVLLTSHYMADVVALCERVIVIHHGGLLYDGPLAGLTERFGSNKILTVTVTATIPDLSGYGNVLVAGANKASLSIPRNEISDVASRLLADLDVADLSIEDPPIEDVIEHTFNMGDRPVAGT